MTMRTIIFVQPGARCPSPTDKEVYIYWKSIDEVKQWYVRALVPKDENRLLPTGFEKTWPVPEQLLCHYLQCTPPKLSRTTTFASSVITNFNQFLEQGLFSLDEIQSVSEAYSPFGNNLSKPYRQFFGLPGVQQLLEQLQIDKSVLHPNMDIARKSVFLFEGRDCLDILDTYKKQAGFLSCVSIDTQEQKLTIASFLDGKQIKINSKSSGAATITAEFAITDSYPRIIEIALEYLRVAALKSDLDRVEQLKNLWLTFTAQLQVKMIPLFGDKKAAKLLGNLFNLYANFTKITTLNHYENIADLLNLYEANRQAEQVSRRVLSDQDATIKAKDERIRALGELKGGFDIKDISLLSICLPDTTQATNQSVTSFGGKTAHYTKLKTILGPFSLHAFLALNELIKIAASDAERSGIYGLAMNILEKAFAAPSEVETVLASFTQTCQNEMLRKKVAKISENDLPREASKQEGLTSITYSCTAAQVCKALLEQATNSADKDIFANSIRLFKSQYEEFRQQHKAASQRSSTPAFTS